MQEYSESTSQDTLKHTDWADLVVYLSDSKNLNVSQLTEWETIFHSVKVAGAGERPSQLPEQLSWHSYDEEATKVEVWNQLIMEAKSDWILFVEDDENIRFLDFPTIDNINENEWPPALILHDLKEKQKQYYQIRFVPKSAGKVFDGKDLADCTRYITENEIGLSNIPILLVRESNPVEHIKPSDELTLKSYAAQLYLVQGEQYFKEGKYVHAAAQYRQLLKSEKLLPFDRLAAVNGMASCMAEQYKWPKAIALAKKSLDAEPFQSIPYLIKYKIYQLQKKWDEAYKWLAKYYDRINLYSRANFDVSISMEETLVNLAKLALKAKLREEATELLNELFDLKNGEVEPEFLQQLLILSVELSDYDKSVFFFKKIFNDEIEQGLDDSQNKELNDYMTMFMQNEWYEFVYKIYSRLYNEHPEEDEYKRRLIVVSIKTNRVEQARKLAAKVA
ncbi:MAG: hypothetical protein FH748_00650 [Balneolaceae bacterium]|nr:hypothetical protein [Balneolaceae bacterium]